MLKNAIFFIGILFLVGSCSNINQIFIEANDISSLEEAISNAKAGDEIILKDGIWKDVNIKFIADGAEGNPIVLKAENPGKVFIEGVSDLKFGGDYLTVSGLYFRNGYTPSNSVIDFKIDEDKLGNHCRVTECVIVDFNQMQRDTKDHWVEFWGRHNELDHCYLSGKSNVGPTIRVEIKGNRNIRNYHKIRNNHFGPRPRKGGPKGETIQLGDSFSSMSPGNTIVSDNYFERCNGEVEVISSKTNYNEFRNNVFFKSEGSVVMRHGNYCIIDGNVFIGDGESTNYGGIRLINTGHWVSNNYFYGLKGKDFRAPLAIMNGIPKSPLNRYNQVTDIVVAHNTWVNCTSPFQVGIGNNIDQKDVLPKSEIRSARPVRSLVSNNLIFNSEADENPLLAYDKLDGVDFKNNYIQNQGVKFEYEELFGALDASLEGDGEYVKSITNIKDLEIHEGFGFEEIERDLLGNSRDQINAVGAISGSSIDETHFFDQSKYGPTWFESKSEAKHGTTVAHNLENGDLGLAISKLNSGDTLKLSPGKYTVVNPIFIDKAISLVADNSQNTELLVEGSNLFILGPGAKLHLQGLKMNSNGSSTAFTTLEKKMSALYNLYVKHCEFENFSNILVAYKESFADVIKFESCSFKNSESGIQLAAETNDKGDYNAEYLIVNDCLFDGIGKEVINYYRGGYDESTIGGNLLLSKSQFKNCGSAETSGILLKTRGIINVDISDCNFENNPVKVAAVLWGAKNNQQSGNTFSNTPEIKVQENLKLTLMY